jgi:hypothetical protein
MKRGPVLFRRRPAKEGVNEFAAPGKKGTQEAQKAHKTLVPFVVQTCSFLFFGKALEPRIARMTRMARTLA